MSLHRQQSMFLSILYAPAQLPVNCPASRSRSFRPGRLGTLSPLTIGDIVPIAKFQGLGTNDHCGKFARGNAVLAAPAKKYLDRSVMEHHSSYQGSRCNGTSWIAVNQGEITSGLSHRQPPRILKTAAGNTHNSQDVPPTRHIGTRA